MKHKERLKQLKSQVDVLTLTATPNSKNAPYVHAWVRDLSVIETPPANRYPVQTFVMEQNPMTIRDGIEREMARGGQVFYLYNRVRNDWEEGRWTESSCPRMSCGCDSWSNGWDDAREYSLPIYWRGIRCVSDDHDYRNRGGYSKRQYPLYWKCTIIWGFLVDQLRGRVGRTNRIAYAYPHVSTR